MRPECLDSVEQRVSALVLAGRRGPKDVLAEACRLSHKALIPVAGVAMVDRVLGSLAESWRVGPIAVIIDAPDRMAALPLASELLVDGRLSLMEAAASPSESVLAACEARLGVLPMLITTADHPLLTAAMVDAFVDEALASGADVAVGLARSEEVLAAFPKTRRTFLKFRDGRYSGCNLFAIAMPAGMQAVTFWRQVERDRKRPWRIARAFGLRALLAYLMGRMTLADALARASRATGCEIRSVVIHNPEAAIDVDKPEDLALAEEVIRRRQGEQAAAAGADPLRQSTGG